MKVNANLVSIANMIAVTIFLFFMDSKDIYYKITMCGPYPTFSFLLQPPEVVTDYDLVKALKESNGTRLSPVNQWNALALQCDQFFLSQLGDKAAHLSTIKAAVKRVAATFATRIGLWDRTLCYELTEMLPPGEFKKHVRAIEHGCIWMDMKRKEKVVFHIEPAAGKYYRALSDMMGLQWHTMDYLSLGNGIFLRARAFMKTYYDVGQSTDGKKYFRHDVTSDLGVDGTLYYVLMINEIAIVLINAADVGIVAMIAVRPLLRSKRTSVYSTDSTSTSTNTPVSLKKLSVQLQNRGSKSQVYVRTESVQLKQSEKNSTLSKMLLYTDLTSVSYHKPLLSMLLVVDTLLSWLWVVPNSNVFAWATIAFQVGSAYLSIFRVWIIVLILIDDLWKWTFVFVHEKLAALITEFMYVKSFEIMCATLIGIYIAYDDIMNICVLKHGLVDGQRAMTPTSPTLASFYNSYTQYSWGDRSNDHEALFFALLARLLVNLALKHHKGTLLGEVETFWRSYQRNSAEVFMNTPMRANALIRSQHVMSYRFGKLVFIRPFVYLEQNFYITRGKFRVRPAIPFLMNEDAEVGADVETKSYMLKGVFRDENSSRLQRSIKGTMSRFHCASMKDLISKDGYCATQAPSSSVS